MGFKHQFPGIFNGRLPALLNGIVTKFPAHKGVAKIKEMNERQLALKTKFNQLMNRSG
jgi:hypothetical protein